MRKFCIYCRVWQATDGIVAHAHCMLDTEDYKYAHSGCVILIAFPQLQWLHERASVLRYTYIACLVRLYVLHDIMTLNIRFPTMTLDSGY
jgi:hypothetical protein